MYQSAKKYFVLSVCFIIAVIFLYASIDKLQEIEVFTIFLGRLKVIGVLSPILAWTIPILEIAIALLLFVPAVRQSGLIASAILLSAFTIYLGFLRLTTDNLPCSCGGVISSFSWGQHILFNTILIVLILLAIFFNRRSSQNSLFTRVISG